MMMVVVGWYLVILLVRLGLEIIVICVGLVLVIEMMIWFICIRVFNLMFLVRLIKVVFLGNRGVYCLRLVCMVCVGIFNSIVDVFLSVFLVFVVV